VRNANRTTRCPSTFLAAEDAIAMPVALAILVLVWGLATIALREGLTAQTQAQRDRDVKRALQAANAGVETALYRMNLIQPSSLQCITLSAGTLTVSLPLSDGWCAPQTEDLGYGVSYAARVSTAVALHANGQALVERKVVSTGTANGVRRRIFTRITAATGEPVFAAGYAGVSLNAVDVTNSVHVNGGLGSNGNIVLKNSAQVCGTVTPGPGKSLTIQNSAQTCGGYSTAPASTSFNFQPVDQGNAPTVNDNFRIGSPPSSINLDPCTSCSGISWNPVTRVLKVQNSATLTLGGNVYSFCRIELANTGQLKIAARPPGTSVRIYVDAPENCAGGGSGMGSVSVRNDSSIVNMNTDPTTLQVYVVGSPTTPTSVDFSNGVSLASDLVIALYAPYSTVSLRNNVRITGTIAARQLELSNSATLTYDSRIEDITTGSPLRLYRGELYKECANDQVGSVVDSAC
jgi:type II secretory pathway pseudopilin PulG